MILIVYNTSNRRKVGMVFQAYALFPNMTVAENIGYGLRITGKPKTEIQQRVALARARAFKPQVLLLDEPLYLGAIVRIQVDVKGSRFTMDMFNEHNLAIPRAGDAYDIHFPVEACWLI